MDLSDRVAIVTGGAKGIGLALAECLIRLGADVMLVDWRRGFDRSEKLACFIQRDRFYRC